MKSTQEKDGRMDSIRTQKTFCTQPLIPTKALQEVQAVASVNQEDNKPGLRKGKTAECKGVIGVMMMCHF